MEKNVANFSYFSLNTQMTLSFIEERVPIKILIIFFHTNLEHRHSLGSMLFSLKSRSTKQRSSSYDVRSPLIMNLSGPLIYTTVSLFSQCILSLNDRSQFAINRCR